MRSTVARCAGSRLNKCNRRRIFMARTTSKSGRKTGSGRKKATTKRGGRKTAASARSKTGARKTASKRGGARKTTRKTGARKTSRKTAARGGARGRSAGSKARSTRTPARKTSRSSGHRGRKSRSSQISATDNLSDMGGEGGEGEEGGGQLEGEGSYTASRHFRTAQTGFVQRNRGRVTQMGKEAEAALEGREGDELRGAEEEARAHSAGDDQW
jgi:hypothetical protein